MGIIEPTNATQKNSKLTAENDKLRKDVDGLMNFLIYDERMCASDADCPPPRNSAHAVHQHRVFCKKWQPDHKFGECDGCIKGKNHCINGPDSSGNTIKGYQVCMGDGTDCLGCNSVFGTAADEDAACLAEYGSVRPKCK